MKLVKKIIFRDNETYNSLYQGSELLFEVQKEVEWKGLTFTALEPSTIKYTPSSLSTAQYSYNTVNWKTADNVTINLNTGDKVYFKGTIPGNQTDSNYAQFTMTGKVAASGSIMSLHNENPQDKSLRYYYEFYSMFRNCTSLVTAPELPANEITYGCYSYMFYGCTSLKTAPTVLPGIGLRQFCYEYMFYGCTSLETAPELSSRNLAPYCYFEMFYNCSKLNYIKCDAIEYHSSWFNDWLYNVAPTGDFYCYDSIIFPTGSSGIPEGWTVHSEVEHKEYDVVYVSGRYELKIPKGDGTYYVIDTKNDCEADIITNKDFTSINSTIIGSTTVGDQYEWELFFTNTGLYFDLSAKNSRRLAWTFGTITKDTKYTIGGSNGNYLGTDRALYVNGSKKKYSTTKSTYNNTSDIFKIGGNIYDFYVGNIKIYESTGLVYHIVPIMYNGNVAFYDKVNKRFMEIKSTPPSEYAKTRTTGEKVII